MAKMKPKEIVAVPEKEIVAEPVRDFIVIGHAPSLKYFCMTGGRISPSIEDSQFFTQEEAVAAVAEFSKAIPTLKFSMILMSSMRG